MSERKGITVMMLGFIIGIVLLVVFIVFVMMFYEGDLFGGILNGLRNAVSGIFGGGNPFLQGGDAGGGGVGNPTGGW